jgi:hypothetical protein
MVAIEPARLRPDAFRPSTGPSGTLARHATARDPARMPVARSSFGGAWETMPVVPPCVWTSTEMNLPRTARAAERSSDVTVAAIAEGWSAQPPSMAPTEVSTVPRIQFRRVSA